MKGTLIKQETHYHLAFDKEIVGSTHEIIADKYKLSLKNCQAIERGYDLDELAEKYAHYMNDEDGTSDIDFKVGFQKALEILGDKKFSEEDVRKSMSRVWYWCKDAQDEDCDELYELENKYIQSLQQTEWGVEVEMICPHPSDTYRCGIQYGCDEDGCNHPNQVPYLDADGCLILKKVE